MEDFKFISEKGLSLALEKEFVLENIENVFGSLENIETIVLDGELAKHGERINGEIYRNDKFCRVRAALTRGNKKLNQIRENTISYFPFPSVIHSSEEVKDFGNSQTIKSSLSFYWFILTFFMTFLVCYLLLTSYPKNKYYHVKNKRIIIEPGWF